MTEKIFYQDPYQTAFEAQVISCTESGKGYEVILDRTAFYPEGGGQPCDTGVLGGTYVTEVHEKNGQILHTVTAPLEEGTQVSGEINWDRRLDHMQQHSGEHIVSGMIHERFGYDNIGFHLGSEVIEIDFNGEIPDEAVKEIEAAANRYVWENHELQILWPSPEELKTLPYRSKKELTGDVRITFWPGADMCACCGTHLLHSGEIGQITLISSMRMKGGTRIEMICGGRSLAYTAMLKEQNRRISNLLSARWNETAGAVEKLQAEVFRLRALKNEMEQKQSAALLKDLAGAGDVLLFPGELSGDNLRRLADEGKEICGGRFAAFSGNDAEGYHYCIGLKDGDLRAFSKEMNTALGGRGGGKPFFVQGSVPAKESQIRAFFERG